MTAPAKASPPVPLGKLLTEDLILYSEVKVQKADAIRDLLGRLSAARNLGSPEPLLAKVLEREIGPSTTLDTGIAIPHARVPGLKEIAAVLGVFPAEVTDPAQPDLPIRCMFLFVTPDEKQFFQAHLKLLRRIAVVFQPALIEKLLAAGSPQKALELIRAKD